MLPPIETRVILFVKRCRKAKQLIVRECIYVSKVAVVNSHPPLSDNSG